MARVTIMKTDIDVYREMFKSVSVLVVDDAAPMRDLVKYMLRKVGIVNFYEAANGEEAFAILLGAEISLIIADWNMPKLNGVELVAKLRNHDRLKTVPVIMVSGEGDKSHVIKAIQAGASDYVLKPISAEILLKKVFTYLRLAQRSEENIGS